MAKNAKSKKTPSAPAAPAVPASAPAEAKSAVNGSAAPGVGRPEPVDAQGVAADGRVPSSMMRSYALLTPDLKQLYMGFYKATYGKSLIEIKHKEFVAIAAALALGCKGCLEGHLKKAKKHGATPEEISEVIAITLGVAAATIVDRSDIANFNLGGLFEMPQSGH